MRNKAVNIIRRQKFVTDEEIDPESADDEQMLEEKLIADERRRALYKVLEGMSEDYRNALYLVYIEDMSYEDAGRVMGKNRKQVENLVFRAKAAAKKELLKEGVGYEE
jgi:RNA polymerase sigma-70 factor (ECF subfamily)